MDFYFKVNVNFLKVTLNYKIDETIERCKVKLEAKEFIQTHDYLGDFCTSGKMNTVKISLFLTTDRNWNLWQFDMKNAFLRGNIVEEIYLEGTTGYIRKIENTFWKLKNTFYYLKQSP